MAFTGTPSVRSQDGRNALTSMLARSESSSAVPRVQNEDHVSTVVSPVSRVIKVKSFFFPPVTLALYGPSRALAGLDHHVGQTLLLQHLVVVDEDERYGREARRRAAQAELERIVGSTARRAVQEPLQNSGVVVLVDADVVDARSPAEVGRVTRGLDDPAVPADLLEGHVEGLPAAPRYGTVAVDAAP